MFLLLTFIALNLSAQEEKNQFRYLSVKDGLSSSKTTCILQDYKGFMWIGTFEGLNRYDGNKIIIYNLGEVDSLNYSRNTILTLVEDHNKNLLIGTTNGIMLYNRDLNRLQQIDLNKTPGWGTEIQSVMGIIEDSVGNLWLATFTGLKYYNRKNNIITNYTYDPADSNSIASDVLKFIYVDKRKRFWVGTEKGLCLFNSKTGRFKRINHCITHNENINTSFIIGSVAEDKNGNVWFGSQNGLFCCESGQNTSGNFSLKHYRNDPHDPNSISAGNVLAIFVNEDGTLLVSTENTGINILQADKNKFLHQRMDDYNPMSLNNESVQAISKDRSNNLWLCTYGGGVNISVKNSNFIFHYKKLPGASESLGSNIIRCFVEDKNHKIWIGTDGAGLCLFNHATNRFTHFNTNNSKITSDAIICMAEGINDDIWIGTWGGGLVNYNTNTNTFKSFTTENSNITDNIISSIAVERNGNLWIGTFNQGFLHYKIRENKFINYFPDNKKMHFITKLDNKGLVYFGTYSGLHIFNPELKSYSAFYSSRPNSPIVLSDGSIYDILIENDTSLWVATSNGLNHINTKSKKNRKYYAKDGLPDNIIKGLTLDKEGILWVTTNKGLSRFDYKNNKIRNFTPDDGIQGDEFYEHSILTTKNGSILAGGTNGFNYIFPDKVPFNKTIPDVVITDFLIFNQPVKIGTKDSPLSKQITDTKSINISYKQSVITFHFSVLDFTNPSKNQYAYMMENFDSDWVYCGNKKEATYTNLNPGKYRFRVKGSNNDGVWNETGTFLEITITPPWWKTKIAIALFVFFVIGSFFAIYAYRITKLKKQKAILENLVSLRTRELVEQNEIIIGTNKLLKEHQLEIENKNLILIKQTEQLNDTNTLLEERQMQIEEQAEELMVQKEELLKQKNDLDELNKTKDKLFSILSHDLRSPFNSIIGYSELLFRNLRRYPIEKIEIQLGVIRDAGRNTLILLNDLLEWSRSQLGAIHVELQDVIITDLLEKELVILKQQAERKEVNLKVEHIGSEFAVIADPDLISTVIRNLISNAIKFSNLGNTVLVLLKFEDNIFTFSVKDEGIGMSKEKIEKLFKVVTAESTRGTAGEKGTGLGLLLCADFIAKHNGEILVESEVGKGSTFSFSLFKT